MLSCQQNNTMHSTMEPRGFWRRPGMSLPDLIARFARPFWDYRSGTQWRLTSGTFGLKLELGFDESTDDSPVGCFSRPQQAGEHARLSTLDSKRTWNTCITWHLDVSRSLAWEPYELSCYRDGDSASEDRSWTTAWTGDVNLIRRLVRPRRGGSWAHLVINDN